MNALQLNIYSLCYSCRHLDEAPANTCAAFPDGIPSAFLNGEESHLEPHPGDHGIRFEIVATAADDDADDE